MMVLIILGFEISMFFVFVGRLIMIVLLSGRIIVCEGMLDFVGLILSLGVDVFGVFVVRLIYIKGSMKMESVL